MGKFWLRFHPQQEYVDSFTKRGKIVPPFIAWYPYEVRDGVEGYMVPCKQDDLGAEEWESDDNSLSGIHKVEPK